MRGEENRGPLVALQGLGGRHRSAPADLVARDDLGPKRRVGHTLVRNRRFPRNVGTGHEMPLGEVVAKVHHAPGITPDALVLEVPGALFTGDTLLIGTVGLRDAPGSDPEAWFEGATEHEGSWWPDWIRWLRRRSGKLSAPPSMGSDTFPPIMDAPGSYVLES